MMDAMRASAMSPASRFNLRIEHPQVTSKRAQSMRARAPTQNA